MKKLSVFKPIFLSLLLIFLYGTNSLQVFGQNYQNINLSNDTGIQRFPVVEISHVNPDIAVSAFYSNGNVQFCRTTDGGFTWSAPKLIDSLNINNRPYICVDYAGNFYLAVKGNDGLPYSYNSTNNGLSFNSRTLIYNAALSTYTAISLTCDMNPSSPFFNTIYLAWNGNNLSKSTNGGISWQTSTMNLSFGYGTNLAISPNGQINVLSFIDGPNATNIYNYNRSTNGGITFSAADSIEVGFTMAAYWSVYYPSIAVDLSDGEYRGNIYCVMSNIRVGADNLENVFFVKSTDYGDTWSAPVRVNDYTPFTFHHNPKVSVSNTGIIAIDYYSVPVPAWNSDEAWIAYSKDGVTFTNKVLSRVPGVESGNAGVGPSISFWGNKPIPVWTDSRFSGNLEVYTAFIPTYTVSGMVTFRDNGQPVTSGYVKALSYNPQSGFITTVDSTIIEPDGHYTLHHMPQDSTDIMFYENDDALNFVPTYYISTIDWRQATKIYPDHNLTNINGQVYRINNTAGPFAISGGTFWTPPQSAISALNDVIVYATIGTDYKNYGISLGNGNYHITKLQPGTYLLTARRIGFDPVSKYVTITNQKMPGIDFIFGVPLIVQNENTNIPKSYNLYQNYPNPFNPETKIKFDIPKDGNVNIVIYDIMGREVAKLTDENLKAGSYSVNWNASEFASGVYFYRMETEQFTVTKKMLLIK